MAQKPANKIGEKKGAAGRGRPKGSPNKTTAILKDAILLAAESVGEDGKGKDGLEGYLRSVATSDMKAFTGLLGRVLPLQLTGLDGGPIEHKPLEMTDDELLAVATGSRS